MSTTPSTPSLSKSSALSLASIVDEAGETLIRASHSTNIKERRDCSTALVQCGGRNASARPSTSRSISAASSISSSTSCGALLLQ